MQQANWSHTVVNQLLHVNSYECSLYKEISVCIISSGNQHLRVNFFGSMNYTNTSSLDKLFFFLSYSFFFESARCLLLNKHKWKKCMKRSTFILQSTFTAHSWSRDKILFWSIHLWWTNGRSELCDGKLLINFNSTPK